MDAQIAIGPAPYSWGRDKLLKFYTEEVVGLNVDYVYVGDNVCFKRNILSLQDLEKITSALKSSGKKVYFSTLALLTKDEEFEFVASAYPLFDGMEANMIGFLNLLKRPELKELNKELILGPYLNLYNWKSADFLKKYNPARMVSSFEIPLESIQDISEKTKIPVELTVWGEVSTALSWRCYTARAVEKDRKNCGCACLDFPQGMLLKSIEGEDLFKIDGLQVLSSSVSCFIEHLGKIDQADIKCLRILPDLNHTKDIVDTFREVADNNADAGEGLENLKQFAPHGFCNGWLFGKPGWEYVAG